MIIPDINLLLYAHVAAFPEPERARQWWEALMNGTREVGIAAPALFGFVRLVSNPRVLDRPMAVSRRWLASRDLPRRRRSKTNSHRLRTD